MPLTLWVIVAAVVLYLYIRRANLGIDKHPGEKVTVRKGAPPVLPPIPPGAVFIPQGPGAVGVVP